MHSGPREDVQGNSGENPGGCCTSTGTFLGGVYEVVDVAKGETLAKKRSGRGVLRRGEDV